MQVSLYIPIVGISEISLPTPKVRYIIILDFRQATTELIIPVAYLFTLQKIVSSANHLSLRAMTQNVGNWIDTDSVQAAYNRNAVPGNDQMTQVEGRSAVFYLVHSSTPPAPPPRSAKHNVDLHEPFNIFRARENRC